MLKSGIFVILASCALVSSVFGEAMSQGDQQIYSPTASMALVELAQEIICESEIECDSAKRAIILLQAAQYLDPKLVVPLDEMLVFANLDPENDYSEVVYRQLLANVSSGSDIAAPIKAAAYLFHNKNTRSQRQVLLEKILKNVGVNNDFFACEIALELGILAAEISDSDSATYYFKKAYSLNPYNMSAFDKLMEISPDSISYSDYGLYLRRKITVNPFDINYVVDFAVFCHKYGMHELAVKAYAYAIDLFDYQMPGEKLPSVIYVPYAESIVNSNSGVSELFKLLSRLRSSGIFDPEIEVLATLNYVGTTDDGLLVELANNVEEGYERGAVSAQQMAWFYSFGLSDPERALNMANKAYSSETDNVAIKAIFAYALAQNGQSDVAKDIAKDIYKVDQIAAFAYSKILLAEENKTEAIEVLKNAISINPVSFVAKECAKILAQNESEFIPPVDSISLANRMKSNFYDNLVPDFKKPEELVALKMGLSGTEFVYYSAMDAKLTVTNISDRNIVIDKKSFIAGKILVDAKLTGDVEMEIPALIEKELKPGYLIQPGYSATFEIRLDSGLLNEVLAVTPQAEVDIDFITYLDPIIVDGKLETMLGDFGKIKTTAQRNRVDFTRKYMLQRMDVLENGSIGQKIASIELFAGLLAEQAQIQKTQAKYRYRVLPPAIINSSLERSLTQDSWETKISAIKALSALDIDFSLVSAISSNLNDPKWPLRLAVLDVLARKQGASFDGVLEWVSKSDANPLVRAYAIALLEQN